MIGASGGNDMHWRIQVKGQVVEVSARATGESAKLLRYEV